MEVKKIENPPDTLSALEFVRIGDEDFKKQIKDYMEENYPNVPIEEVFMRLVSFGHGACRVDMTGAE